MACKGRELERHKHEAQSLLATNARLRALLERAHNVLFAYGRDYEEPATRGDTGTLASVVASEIRAELCATRKARQ